MREVDQELCVVANEHREESPVVGASDDVASVVARDFLSAFDCALVSRVRAKGFLRGSEELNAHLVAPNLLVRTSSEGTGETLPCKPLKCDPRHTVEISGLGRSGLRFYPSRPSIALLVVVPWIETRICDLPRRWCVMSGLFDQLLRVTRHGVAIPAKQVQVALVDGSA